MSAGRGSRNNVLAGLFVIVSIALAVTTILLLSNIGAALTPKSTYTVRFNLDEGAEGLERGSVVKVGGKEVGRVLSSRFFENPVTGEPAGIDVDIEVRSDIVLYQDADAQLIKPLLGTSSTINISAMPPAVSDDPRPGPPGRLVSGGMLQGRVGPPGFLTQDDYSRIQEIIDRVNRITAEVEPMVPVILDDVKAVTGDARTIARDAEQRWKEWAERIGTALAEAEKAALRFDLIAANVQAGVDDGRAFVARARAVIDENRASIDQVVENVRELTAKAKGEGYEQVLATLKSGREGLESFGSAARRADELLARSTPELEQLVADAALAAGQLRLLTVEVRASPWRLLYQPNRKELENELLYNSVRAYSQSIAELRAAAARLEAAAAIGRAGDSAEGSGAGRPLDEAAIRPLLEGVKGAYERFEAQDRKFRERWVGPNE